MRVLISGSSGLVGTAVAAELIRSGSQVVRLVRNGSNQPDTVHWDPAQGTIDAAGLEGLDAVIHLAGENIASGRWTAARKQRIRQSRILGTRLLSEALAGRTRRPSVLVCASAIGLYGDRGAEVLNESSGAAKDFLGQVCQDWEAASDAARHAGIRVVKLRIGIVLSKDGGALARMLTPFKLGLGGRIGSGQQYMSWISLPDLVRVFTTAVENTDYEGPINAVAPQQVTNAEFTKCLGRVLKRPTLVPLPAFAARLLLGEMADALLLASTRVEPRRLRELEYRFVHERLESALRAVLQR